MHSFQISLKQNPFAYIWFWTFLSHSLFQLLKPYACFLSPYILSVTGSQLPLGLHKRGLVGDVLLYLTVLLYSGQMGFMTPLPLKEKWR